MPLEILSSFSFVFFKKQKVQSKSKPVFCIDLRPEAQTAGILMSHFREL